TVETVIAHLATGANGRREKWKYSRYSDNPQFWSAPNPPIGPQRDVMTHVYGNMNRPGHKQAATTVKTHQVPDQAEAYNVSRDPLELVNLVHSTDPAVQATISELETMLHQQCEAKLLKPTSGTVPGQPDC
ncbi:MAG: hypothetical protein QOG05_6404, partial [Streptosporangiaceae bacterium]|nr:hypothetical protein [Streptosporangiaceae bacterium]